MHTGIRPAADPWAGFAGVPAGAAPRCEAGWAERATRRSRRSRKLTPRRRAADPAGTGATAGPAGWSWDVPGDVLVLSARAREILGLPRARGGEGIETLLAVLHPDDRSAARVQVRAAAVRGAPLDGVFRLAPAGAVERTVHLSSAGARGRPRQRVRVEGTVEDISARRHLEDSLRETSAILQLVAENTRDIIWVRDANTLALQYVNPVFDKWFGRSGAALLGVRGTLLDVVNPDDQGRVATALDEARRGPVSVEFRVLPPDGRPRRVRARMFPVPGGDGVSRKIVGLVEDVGARRSGGDEPRRFLPLDQASRAAILGEVASAIAHELGQPLFAILNYARGCLRYLDRGEADLAGFRVAVTHIATHAERSGRVLNGLRDMAGGKPPRTRAEDVNALVREAVSIALGEHPHGGPPTRLALGRDLPRAAADPVQVVLVIVNLIRNAVEAVAGRREGRVVIHTSTDPAGVRVAVSDNGPGVAPEITSRLFDPLATTKPDGMGVGLAVSRSIVEGHGGRIWIEPAQAAGTTVAFTLPAAPKEAFADG